MSKSTPYTQASQALQRQRSASPSEVVKQFKSFLDARMGQLAKWITGGIRPEALVRFCLLDLQTNEKLRQCTKESLYLGLLACAVSGLEPGALKGHAYLVPFAGKAVFMPGWRGLVVQARRSREVVGMTANVVREQDTFDLDLGTSNSLIHKPARGNRGEVVGSYAIANLASGHREIEFLDREDLDRIQKVAEARGRSPAWRDWEDQMQRKSAIRRIAKRLPLGHDYMITLALEQAHDDGRSQSDVLDIETDGAASASEAQLDRAPHIDEPAFNPEADIPNEAQ